ncbi:hypothetical protein TorRG33x02_038740 [Trema orientale]|uniref:Ankyrin repeat-containing domain containing protein n=1 Tax=Trema orientale TaxID=63057 RepID=A0A2P5FRR3_TREOI|nr:hypothetical protein TorRG33x02_038740 [Trema orientale]
MVHLLIAVEPKVTCVENKEGEASLFLAPREGKAEIVIHKSMETPSAAHGGNSVHDTIIGGSRKCGEVEGLKDQPDIKGNTPLHVAAVERETWTGGGIEQSNNHRLNFLA